MGILLDRSEDSNVYKDAYEEAQRIIRISEEVRVSLERVSSEADQEESPSDKLTTSKLAKKLGKSTDELLVALVIKGYLKAEAGKHELTKEGENIGASFVPKGRFGAYFLWPESISLSD